MSTKLRHYTTKIKMIRSPPAIKDKMINSMYMVVRYVNCRKNKLGYVYILREKINRYSGFTMWSLARLQFGAPF